MVKYQKTATRTYLLIRSKFFGRARKLFREATASPGSRSLVPLIIKILRNFLTGKIRNLRQIWYLKYLSNGYAKFQKRCFVNIDKIIFNNIEFRFWYPKLSQMQLCLCVYGRICISLGEVLKSLNKAWKNRKMSYLNSKWIVNKCFIKFCTMNRPESRKWVLMRPYFISKSREVLYKS